MEVVLRPTTDGYANGDMTVVDFPFGFPITLHGGSASVTKKVGDILLGMNQPRFSDCTSLEIVSVAVRDPNGNVFAVPGVRH